MPAIADVTLMAVAIFLARFATSVACSAVPPRKFPPPSRSMSVSASSTLPVTLESMDAASLNFDPSFFRCSLNFSDSGSRRSPLSPVNAMSDDRSLCVTLPISSMLRPWVKSMLYPPSLRMPRP